MSWSDDDGELQAREPPISEPPIGLRTTSEPAAGGQSGEEVLSPATTARLRAGRGADGSPPLFTTTGSAGEVAALGAAGLRPLSTVRGSSVHHVGTPGPTRSTSTEMPDLTRSLYTARHYALARLVAAAGVVGAVGVVGVTMTQRSGAFGDELVEILVSGTAVTDGDPLAPGATPHVRAPDRQPWTTSSAGAELVELLGTGLVPVAVVFGTCVHHLERRPTPETEWPGEELPAWTVALTDAREVALARVQAEARRHRADGVIALTESEVDQSWHGAALEYLVTGDAVRRRRRGSTTGPGPAVDGATDRLP